MRLWPVLLLVLAASLSAQRRTREPRVLKAGEWRIEIRYEATSPPGNHVTSFLQVVRRFGPGADEGELIHQESSTGFAHAFLRDDGLCFVDPVGKQPFLSFPDGETLTYPLPPSETCPDWGYDDLSVNSGGRVHFLGDQCVITRQVNARMQIATFEVDLDAHTATPLRSILEVCGQGSRSQRVARAALPQPLMLRLGDVMFWVNHGDWGDLYPLEESWRIRKLRAFDLAKGALIDPESLTHQWLFPHREEIYAFLESESHNVIPEFEMWAIPRFGEGHWTTYTDRLIQLFAAMKPTGARLHVEGKLRDVRRPLRQIYLEALIELNRR